MSDYYEHCETNMCHYKVDASLHINMSLCRGVNHFSTTGRIPAQRAVKLEYDRPV